MIEIPAIVVLILAHAGAHRLVAHTVGTFTGGTRLRGLIPGVYCAHAIARASSRRRALLVVLTGTSASYLMLVLGSFLAQLAVGNPGPHSLRVQEIIHGSAADGILAVGDRMLRIGDVPLTWGEDEPPIDIGDLVQKSRGNAVEIEIEREGVRQVVSVIPSPPSEQSDRFLLGVKSADDVSFAPVGPGDAVGPALLFPAAAALAFARGLFERAHHLHETEELVGPVGLRREVEEATDNLPRSVMRALELSFQVAAGLLCLDVGLLVLAMTKRGRAALKV